MTIKAMFDCTSETRHQNSSQPGGGPRQFKLQAVKPEAGSSDENDPEVNAFWTATPSGTIELWISNPKAYLEIGKRYYISFEPHD